MLKTLVKCSATSRFTLFAKKNEAKGRITVKTSFVKK
jgi:hypothetical protein